MSTHKRRHTDKVETLEQALALYPPDHNPSLLDDITRHRRDSAGWILAKTIRQLVKEMVAFHRLFLALRINGQHTEEYSLVRRADIDVIDSLWKRFYHFIPEPDEIDEKDEK